MCPQSEVLKNKIKELEQPLPKPPQQQPQQQAYSSSASTSAISLPQRLFGFMAPVSFAYLLYSSPLFRSFVVFVFVLQLPLPLPAS